MITIAVKFKVVYKVASFVRDRKKVYKLHLFLTVGDLEEGDSMEIVCLVSSGEQDEGSGTIEIRRSGLPENLLRV